MVLTERTVSQIFLTIITINSVHPRDESLGILSDYIGKDSRSPFFVVIKSPEDAKALDEEIMESFNRNDSAIPSEPIYRDHISAKLESTNAIFNAMIGNSNNNILRTNDQSEREEMILQAIRSRCNAIAECEEVCSAKKDDSCSLEEYGDTCEHNEYHIHSCSESLEKCSESESDECSYQSHSHSKKKKTHCERHCKSIYDDLLKCPSDRPNKNKYNHRHRHLKLDID